MPVAQLIACFFGGVFLTNAVPHLCAGVMGRAFPSPFAKPPGKGLSSALVNVLWGFANLVVAWVLLVRLARIDLGDLTQAAALGLGVLLLGLLCAWQFGAQNGGKGPGPA